MPNINEPDASIQCYHQEWTRNRHVIDGARLIRQYSRNYLPMVYGQSVAEYQAYVNRVPFFPAASRTHDGLIGLMFRKAATVNAPDAVLPLLNTITATGDTLDDLAEEVASELLITNFCGLVVDYPATPAGITKAEAAAFGSRPFVAVYRAESILGIEVSVVNNQQTVTRVRLLDDETTLRELRLDDGQYSVTMHYLTNGSWVAGEPMVALKNGAALSKIPFTLVSTKRGYKPTTAPLSDVCDHNIQHYLANANLATCHYFSSAPIFNIFGTDGNPEDFQFYPGAIWVFSGSDGNKSAETKILEYTGVAMDKLRDFAKDIKDEMAAIGSRILASDKASVESADALAIRRASENATLASIARIVSRKINDTLAIVADWLDLPGGSLTYEANTDFNSLSLSSLDITARMSLWQSGAISLDAFLDMLQDGEVLPESFDREADKEKVQIEKEEEPTQGLPTTPAAPFAPKA